MFGHRRVHVVSVAVAGMVGLFASHRATAATADFLYEPQMASESGVAPGATVNLELFLLANTTNGVNIVNTYDGLLSVGCAMAPVSSTGQASYIGYTTNSKNVQLADFAFDTTDFGGPTQVPKITSNGGMQGASEAIGTSATDGVTFGNVGPNSAGVTVVNPAANHEIYIGTVTLIAGGAGSSTVFDIGINGTYPGSDGGFSLTNLPAGADNGYDLDDPSLNNPGGPSYVGVENNVTTFTLNVAGTIPEPGTLGLLGAGSTLVLLRRRRRLA
jgi:hypothetical protein